MNNMPRTLTKVKIGATRTTARAKNKTAPEGAALKMQFEI
jgi:hypothetical protein